MHTCTTRRNMILRLVRKIRQTQETLNTPAMAVARLVHIARGCAGALLAAAVLPAPARLALLSSSASSTLARLRHTVALAIAPAVSVRNTLIWCCDVAVSPVPAIVARAFSVGTAPGKVQEPCYFGTRA
jgi:hypothetical protein